MILPSTVLEMAQLETGQTTQKVYAIQQLVAEDGGVWTERVQTAVIENMIDMAENQQILLLLLAELLERLDRIENPNK